MILQTKSSDSRVCEERSEKYNPIAYYDIIKIIVSCFYVKKKKRTNIYFYNEDRGDLWRTSLSGVIG